MEKNLKSLIVLLKSHQSLLKVVKESLKDTDINMNEFTAMEALYEKGQLTTQELVNTVLIPNSSMTYVLDILEKKNYIEKNKNDEDKRIQMIDLSSKGTAFFEKTYQKHFNHMRKVFDTLTMDEERTLQELLKKVGKRAEEEMQ